MDHRQLLNDLLTEFRESELKTICSNLRLVYETLQGKDRGERAYHLIRLMARNGRLSSLVKEMIALRPGLATRYDHASDLGWLDMVAKGESAPADELPTQKWAHKSDPAPDLESSSVQMLVRAAAEEGPTQTWPESDEEPPEAVHDLGSQTMLARSHKSQVPSLVGRQRELARLIERLSRGGSCAISGGPGIGKTTLIQSLCSDQAFPSESRVLVAYVSARDRAMDSSTKIHNAALAGWYRKLSDAPAPKTSGFTDFARQTRTLRGADIRPVLCLDGLDYLLESSDWAIDALLADWAQLMNSAQVGFVLTARNPVNEIFKEHGLKPRFAREFYQIRLGLLERGIAEELLSTGSARTPAGLDRRTVEIAIAICGRHPYFLVMGREIIRKYPDIDTVSNRQLQSLLLKHIVPHWIRVWDGLTGIEREVLTTLNERDVPLVIARQRQSLEQLGLIERFEGNYRYFSEGFGAWITSQQQNGPRSL